MRQIQTILVLSLLLWGCTSGAKFPRTVQVSGLRNLMQLTHEVYCGGEPQGEDAFASLARMGVKTVVSVDGARPNIEAARKYGLRYVHIPIGYDGVGPKAKLSLARLVAAGPRWKTSWGGGPFYVHCHHGRHRGPVAAVIICMAAGEIDRDEALQILERAGTSHHYGGLWRAVRAYEKPAPGVVLPDLVEVAEVGSLASAMAKIDRVYDQLKKSRDAHWIQLPEHPDLRPDQQALLLKEGFRESGRHLEGLFDPPFKAWLGEAQKRAQKLQEALMAKDALEATERFKVVAQSCTQCHRQYR